jgi:Fe(3+) dicitrate transport protein
MLKGRCELGASGDVLQEIELKAGYSNEFSNETYLGLTGADFEADPYRRYGASRLDRMEWHRTQVALTHLLRRGADLELATTAYRHDLDRVWRKVNGFRGASIADVLADPTSPRNAIFYGVLTGAIPPSTSEETLLIGPNDRRFVSQGVQSALLFRARTGPVAHRLSLGTRIHNDGVKRRHTEDGFLVQGAALVPAGEPTETTADEEVHSTALSLFAVDAATWGPITLTAGARIESIHGELEDHRTGRRAGVQQQVLLPGAGLFAALPRGLGVLAGVVQGFSPIPPGQTELVRPEKSVNYEWGARWAPRRFRAEVIGFYNDYTNLSTVCTFSSGCAPDDLDQQFDGGAAEVYGLEAYVESELAAAKGLVIPGRLAYTFTRATFSTSFTSSDPTFGDVAAGDEIPYVPAHQLSASIGAEAPRWAVNLGGTYMGAMREVAGQGEPAPGEATDAHFLLDAGASVKALPWLTVYVVGRNLLDTVYIASRRPFGARPGAPRWVQVGAKLEL